MKKINFVLFFAIMTTALYAQIQPILVHSENRVVVGAVLTEIADEIRQYQGGGLGNGYGFQFYSQVYSQGNVVFTASVLIPISNAFSYPRNTNITNPATTRDLYNFLRTKQYWANDLKMSFVEDRFGDGHISLIYMFNGRGYPVRVNISYPG